MATHHRQPSSKKVVLFDFDGTIADSLPLMVNVFRRLARQHRQKHLYHLDDLISSDQPLLDHPTIKILRQQGLKPAIDSLKLSKVQLLILYLRARRQFAHQADQLQPITGMPEVIKQLAQEYQLGIVTSNKVSTVQSFLKRHQLDHFELVKSPSNLFGKRQTINQAMNQLGVDLSSTMYVGDEVRDMEAAQRAGIDAIGVSWGLNSRELLSWNHADEVVDQPDQLPAAISKLFNR